MAFKFKLADKVIEFLTKNPEQKFTAREIANGIFKAYPDECLEKQKRSKAKVIPLDSPTALMGQIAAEMGRIGNDIQKKNSSIKSIEGPPRKYYYTTVSDIEEVETAENSQSTTTATTTKNNSIKEQDLYPILTQFLRSELEIYSKRIDEKRSKNSQGTGGNKWLYPDLVGIENLSQDWSEEIKKCITEYAGKKAKLWSFEVKILINRSNLRETFFQTVSNSSWANFGYLVASEIQGHNTLKELRILASSHGIGFIKLDIENPAESQIMVSAKEKSEIDWAVASRLATENKDFSDYIDLVSEFYRNDKLKENEWDEAFIED